MSQMSDHFVKTAIDFYKNIDKKEIQNGMKTYSKEERMNNFIPIMGPSDYKIDSIESFTKYLNNIKHYINPDVSDDWKTILESNDILMYIFNKSLVHVMELRSFDFPDKMLISDPRKVFMSISWNCQDILIRYLLSGTESNTGGSFFLNLAYLIIDYFFDNPDNMISEKRKFADYIGKRLDKEIPPCNLHSKKFDKAMRILEKSYPRERFTDVHEYISALFRVEQMSMESESSDSYDESKLLEIMAMKGMQTVLTIAKVIETDNMIELTKDQQCFLSRLGFLTQIIDDISDIQNDIDSRCFTLNVKVVMRGVKLDQIATHAANYTQMLFEDMIEKNYFNKDPKVCKDVAEVIRFLLMFWLTSGVCKNERYYSKEMYETFQKYCFIEFDDLKSLRSHSKPLFLKNIGSMMNDK